MHKCQKHGRNARVSRDGHGSAKMQGNEKCKGRVCVINVAGVRLSTLHYLWDQLALFNPPNEISLSSGDLLRVMFQREDSYFVLYIFFL